MKYFPILVLSLSLPAILSVQAIELSSESGEQTLIEIAGNTGTFVAEVRTLSPVEGVSRYAVRFPSPIESEYPQNNEVMGEMYIPAGGDITQDPVILLHILNGNFELERLIALELARAGAPALWFKLPFYGDRRPEGVSSSRPVNAWQLLQLLDQGAMDFRRATDFMELWRPGGEGPVNVAGISMGGILSYYFASEEPRVGKIASIMAGGDLWGIIQTARESRNLRGAFFALDDEDRNKLVAELEVRDPLHVAPVLRERADAGKIIMINAENDEVIPRIHAEKLATALGMEEQVVWIKDVGHYSIAAKLGEVIETLVAFLTDGSAQISFVQAEVDWLLNSEAILTGFLSDLGRLVDPSAVRQAGQKLAFDFTWEGAQGQPYEGSFEWRRSTGGLYTLMVDTPQWGRVGLGQSEQPWVFLGGQETLFIGKEKSSRSPLSMAGTSVMLKLQLLANALQYGVRVPGLLEDFGTLETKQEGSLLRLTYQGQRRPMTFLLNFDLDRGEYTYCELRLKEGTLKMELKGLEIATPVAGLDFTPPEAKDVLRVSSSNLQHTLALVLQIFDSKTDIWK